jgi:hypothetical protein
MSPMPPSDGDEDRADRMTLRREPDGDAGLVGGFKGRGENVKACWPAYVLRLDGSGARDAK